MGNSGGKARDPGVKKRSKKKGRKEDRPVSDPTGGLPPDLQVEHSLRRAGSEDITGRYAGGGVVSVLDIYWKGQFIIMYAD